VGRRGFLGDFGGVGGDFLGKIEKKAVTNVVFRTSVLTERMGFGTSSRIGLCCNNRFRFVDDALLARSRRT